MKKRLIGTSGIFSNIQPELVSIYKMPEAQYSGISPYIATYFAYINSNKQVVINSIHSTSPGIELSALGNIGSFKEQIFTLPSGELAWKLYTSGPTMFVITESGKIFPMGFNGEGQCGLKISGTSINTTPINSFTQGFTHDSSNVAISSPFVKMIMPTDLDGYTYFGLTQDGRLYGAGYNNGYTLGTGDQRSSYTLGGPWRPLFSDNVVRTIQDAIVVGGYDGTSHRPTLIVMDSTGAIWGCGENTYGQIAQNNTTSIISKLTRVKSSGTADLSSGFVSLYGCGISFTSATPSARSNTTIFGLHSTGDLYVWGTNTSNTKFDGTTGNILVAKKINSYFNNEAVNKVWTGFYFDSNTFVRTTTGKIYGTGAGDALGIGSTTSTTGWQQLTFFNTTSRTLDNFYTGHVGSGLDITFARTYDTSGNYSLWVTGKNNQGYAGLGMTSDVLTWVEVSLPSEIVKRIVTIASSNWGSCFTVNTGTTVIHLDDGTALIAGKHIPISNNDTIFSKFVPLCRYITSEEPN
jgi:alpha-tubulin suppressor-like RCC1 family protein